LFGERGGGEEESGELEGDVPRAPEEGGVDLRGGGEVEETVFEEGGISGGEFGGETGGVGCACGR